MTFLSAQVQTNHLVISQICLENAFGGGSDDEFVELYNPTSIAVDLNLEDFRIYRATASGIGTNLLCSLNNQSHFTGSVMPANLIIPANGYYLIVNEDASSSLKTNADAVVLSSRMTFSVGNKIFLTKENTPKYESSLVDFVGLSNANIYEGKKPSPNPVSGGSIIRKADAFSTPLSITNGIDTNRGSAFDSDNNYFDFVTIKPVRPRNSSVINPPAVQPVDIQIVKTDVGAVDITGIMTNIPVFSFHFNENVVSNRLIGLKISNCGTMQFSEVSNIMVFNDFGTKGVYDSDDIFLDYLRYDASSLWTNDSLSVTNNSDVLICMNRTMSSAVGNFFRTVLPACGIRISSWDKGPLAGLTNANVQTVVKEQDQLLFSRNFIGSRTNETGMTNILFSFGLKSTKTPIKMSDFYITNRGALQDSSVFQIGLFRKKDSSLANISSIDQFLGFFTKVRPNIWKSTASNVDISSVQPETNYIVTLVTRMDFSNSVNVEFGITESNITGTGTGKAPTSIQTSDMLKITNSRPLPPTGFAVTTTNASSVNFIWTSYPFIRDFDSFVVFHGTNKAKMTNRFVIPTNSARSVLVFPVRAGHINHFRLNVKDKAGQYSTNKSVLSVMTKSDTNAPSFDADSASYYINQKVVHMQWEKATDSENSTPISYEIYVSDNLLDLDAKQPFFSTFQTNTSFSLPAGTHYLRIKAMDAFSNKSATSSFLEVTLVDVTNNAHVYFYPNPARSGDMLRFNNFTDTTSFIIYTLKGKKMIETQEKNIPLPEEMSPGVYYIVIRDGKNKVFKKLVYLGKR